MFFKPRIFISSTISENAEVRKKINGFFEAIGAETMLYEKNLTPATIPMTYRFDILDSDFVIFIIKNKYGKETETGISGTHEEFRLVRDRDIPSHVYIKKGKKERKNEKLIKEIEKYQISFYYFDDDTSLVKRIKETTFTIAKEIMLKKIENMHLSENMVRKIAVNYDYGKAKEIISILDAMFKYHYVDDNKYSLIDTTLFFEIMNFIKMENNPNDNNFINNDLDKLFINIINLYDKFSVARKKDYESTPEKYTIAMPLFKEVTINRVTSESINRNEYDSIIKECYIQYQEFRDLVKEMKLSVDKYS